MVMRIGGLATGIDTDTVIKQMLAREQTRIDKVSAKKQILQWQQESYRDFSTAIKGFKDKYFDVLNKSTYALSSDFFSSVAANITGTDNGLLSVKAGNTAKPGRYSVDIIKEAKGAVLKASVSSDKDLTGQEFRIKTGDMESDTTIKGVKNVKELVDSINKDSKLKGKVTASYSQISGNLIIETIGTGSAKSIELEELVSTAGGLGLPKSGSHIQGSKLEKTWGEKFTSEVITLENKSEAVKAETLLKEIGIKSGSITIAGVKINLDENKKVEDLVTDIKTELDKNDNTKNKYSVDFSNGKISITSKEMNESEENRTEQFYIGAEDGSEVENLKKLGFISKNDTVTDKTASSEKIVTDVNYVIKVAGPADIDKPVYTKINGKDVRVDFKNKTIYEITRNSAGDVEKNDDGTDKLGKKIEDITLIQKNSVYTLTSKSDFNSELPDIGAIVSNSLFTAAGQDAKIEVTLPDGSTGTVTNAKNNFTIDGISFGIKGEGTVNFNVESSVDKSIENIKGFVDAYNELIDSIGSKVYEKKQYTYAPLTDEQKESMKEDEIKNWETKCKQGILRNDSSLTKFLDDLRSAFYVSGETGGSGLSLRDIGIGTTNSYSNRGKLEINEEKLREALTNNPDDVAQIFTRETGTYSADSGYSSNSDRTKGSGIFVRITDIIQDTIRTTRNKNNLKGSLLEKAGIKGDTTETENFITKAIKEKDTMLYDLKRKMQERETQLYKQFAYLEKMTNSYNSQSSWLAQQLGS